MTTSVMLIVGGLLLVVHFVMKNGKSLLKRKDPRMSAIQEVATLAKEFINLPTMNPEKIKVVAALLGEFLPEKHAASVVPVASALAPGEISALIGLVLKIIEVFFPQITPFVPALGAAPAPAPVATEATPAK